MKHKLSRILSSVGCLCLPFFLLSGCAGQTELFTEGSYNPDGSTCIITSADCTNEMNGKSGHLRNLDITGDLPVVDKMDFIGGAGPLDLDPVTSEIRGSPVSMTMSIQGEGPLSVQIESQREYDIYISNDLYDVYFWTYNPSLIQASERGVRLAPTEPTKLERCCFDIIVENSTIGSVSVSGNVEDSLKIIREDAGVYLVEGLSGAGFVKCEKEGADESCLEQKYQDGESRDFRLVWKNENDTPTITAVEP